MLIHVLTISTDENNLNMMKNNEANPYLFVKESAPDDGSWNGACSIGRLEAPRLPSGETALNQLIRKVKGGMMD